MGLALCLFGTEIKKNFKKKHFVLKLMSPKAEADHRLFIYNVKLAYRSGARKYYMNNA